jgi:molybdopterin synthase catalytic subunit
MSIGAAIEVTIREGPLPARAPGCPPAGAGAELVFEGIVRDREGDELIRALDYNAYEPMAQTMLRRLAEELATRLGLLGVGVEHSRGRIPVGQRSFRLVIAAPHRKEALAAMDEFIDRMKRDVPIWKHPVWADEPGSSGPNSGASKGQISTKP